MKETMEPLRWMARKEPQSQRGLKYIKVLPSLLDWMEPTAKMKRVARTGPQQEWLELRDRKYTQDLLGFQFKSSSSSLPKFYTRDVYQWPLNYFSWGWAVPGEGRPKLVSSKADYINEVSMSDHSDITKRDESGPEEAIASE